MTYKSLQPQELKDLYSDRQGFVFLSNSPSERNSCEKLCKQITDYGICEYEPDFINDFNGAAYAFVYPSEVYFNYEHSVAFYEFCHNASLQTGGIFQILTLKHFLNSP